MKHTIYVDVLVCINLFINYFILIATAKFLKIYIKRIRVLAGATLGAFYSLYILLPDMNFALSILVKMVMSVTICLAAFKFTGVKPLIKIVACFYSISFVFCGVMFAIWNLFSPNGLLINNGVVYFNISPIFFIVTTGVSYLLIGLINRISGRDAPRNIFYNVMIEFEGKSVVIRSKLDTGNTLVEPFSNIPVIVVEYANIKEILPQEMKEFLSSGNMEYTQNCKYLKKCRMIPFNTVSANGILPAFLPDKVEIIHERTIERKDAYIAVCSNGVFNGEFKSLINPDLVLV